jgi:hypothetical protein
VLAVTELVHVDLARSAWAFGGPAANELVDYRAAANTAGPMGEPRAQSVTGFNFAMWFSSSSSVAQPMKYRQTIS